MKNIDPSVATKEDIIKRSNYIIHELKEMDTESANGIFDIQRLSRLFSFMEREFDILSQPRYEKYTNSKRIFTIYRGLVAVKRQGGKIKRSNFITNLGEIKDCYTASGIRYIN